MSVETTGEHSEEAECLDTENKLLLHFCRAQNQLLETFAKINRLSESQTEPMEQENLSEVSYTATWMDVFSTNLLILLSNGSYDIDKICLFCIFSSSFWKNLMISFCLL